jgi:hypothetical protein
MTLSELFLADENDYYSPEESEDRLRDCVVSREEVETGDPSRPVVTVSTVQRVLPDNAFDQGMLLFRGMLRRRDVEEYETCVFPCDLEYMLKPGSAPLPSLRDEGASARYTSREEALEGHQRIVAMFSVKH